MLSHFGILFIKFDFICFFNEVTRYNYRFDDKPGVFGFGLCVYVKHHASILQAEYPKYCGFFGATVAIAKNVQIRSKPGCQIIMWLKSPIQVKPYRHVTPIMK